MTEKPEWFQHAANILLGSMLGWIVAHAQFTNPWHQVAFALTVVIAGLLALFALPAWFGGPHPLPQFSTKRVLLIVCTALAACILSALVYVWFLAPRGWDWAILLFPVAGGLLILLKRIIVRKGARS